MMKKIYFGGFLALLFLAGFAVAEPGDDVPEVEENIGKSADGSKTDDEVVEREEEAIKLDGLNAAQIKLMRESSEKHAFQAEVTKMMKLIINSLYKNKEIFLRELISNASDALDKIRFISVTDKSVLSETSEFSIRIKADKENSMLHITDTGVGMTKEELVKNLGTIAKSGTDEFFSKLSDSEGKVSETDLIGQFGVGFYSSFLVADKVVVTSKHNDDDQYIWESDNTEFSVVKDPRGNTLKRGTTISLHMKDEALDYLEDATIQELVKKYSQFISFDIFLWTSKTVEVDATEAESDVKPEEDEAESPKDVDEDATVEEVKEEPKNEKKTRSETVFDWQLMNGAKPLWTRKPSEIEDSEYSEFYKSFTMDSEDPMCKTHFSAEGEVTFKSILFVGKTAPKDMLTDKPHLDNIKMYVRRVFITDKFDDLFPKYLSFLKGIVDSDDLPLNVSRETLQQHKLLRVIKKKLVRKALDMFKKMDEDDYEKFWQEYGIKLKLGVIEDSGNRTRLAKLLRYYTSYSKDKLTSLEAYVERMKPKQEHIYFVGGSGRDEVEKSPFVETLLDKGYEVIYMMEPIDEYAVQSLPEFEGKKFQNVAKEGLTIGQESQSRKDRKGALESEYSDLTTWLADEALKGEISKAIVSDRLTDSPCALVATQYGWSGNMERLMKAQAYAKLDDPNNSYFLNQKRTLEINPRHPLVKELKARVAIDKDDKTTKDLANVLFETATLRSGYQLKDTSMFAERIERMLRLSLDVPLDAKIDEDPYVDEEEGPTSGEAADDQPNADQDEVEKDNFDESKEESIHGEL